jgi:hypothetical protein
VPTDIKEVNKTIVGMDEVPLQDATEQTPLSMPDSQP